MKFKIGDKVRISSIFLNGAIGEIFTPQMANGKYGVEINFGNEVQRFYFHELELSIFILELPMEPNKFKIGDRVKTDCGMQGTVSNVCMDNLHVHFDNGLNAFWRKDKLSLLHENKFKSGEEVYVQAKVVYAPSNDDQRRDCILEFWHNGHSRPIYFNEAEIIKKQDIK